MFVILRQRRQRAKDTNRKKSDHGLHRVQPSTIRVSECSEEVDGLRDRNGWQGCCRRSACRQELAGDFA